MNPSSITDVFVTKYIIWYGRPIGPDYSRKFDTREEAESKIECHCTLGEEPILCACCCYGAEIIEIKEYPCLKLV